MFVYTIGDVFGIICLAVVLLTVLVSAVSKYIKQSMCKHEHYFETMACDAVCRDCGKNLGFIGNVQKERSSGKNEWK